MISLRTNLTVGSPRYDTLVLKRVDPWHDKLSRAVLCRASTTNLAISWTLFFVGLIQVGLWYGGVLPGIGGVLGAASTVLSAFLGFSAWREAKIYSCSLVQIAQKVDETARVSDTALAAANTAVLGRRLSDDEKADIATKLSGTDFGSLRVTVSYIASATGAQDFAENIVDFLSTQLRLRCESPCPENPHAWPQPRPRVSGTLFIRASGASEPARRLADVFALEIPEVAVSGENPAWPFQTSIYEIKIVVGQKR